MDNFRYHIENFNNDFLLLKSEDATLLKHFGKAIYQHQFHFVDEVIVSEREVLLKLNQHFKPSNIELIRATEFDTEIEQREFILPVCFDFYVDWQAVEEYANMPKAKVIEELCSQEYSVSMFGFLPGFLYMSGLPEYLQIPRKAEPAKYVEPNSVAIGGPYLGLYSLSSPGGWHVIGKTPKILLNHDKLPPVEVNLFDTIRLKEIGKEEFDEIVKGSTV